MAGGDQALREAVIAHRGVLWALCYRMTGCAADADDLVQDVIERALTRPPADVERDLKPWLVRVAMNLTRDHLRRRRRMRYPGTWLPGPAVAPDNVLAELRTADAEYGERESVTVAFLTALEALTPSQRAVLLLRDVLGYTVREAAAALDMGEPNVKTTHHRARRAMAAYDRTRVAPTPERLQRHRSVLQALLGHLALRNVDALEALLSEGVRARNDADGEHFAARRAVVGRAKVILFHLKVNDLHLQRTAGRPRFAIRELNGEPALVADWPSRDPRVPRRMVLRIVLDARGRIDAIDTVVAHRKLAHVDFAALPPRPAVRDVAELLRAVLTEPSPGQWFAAALARAARAGCYAATRRRWPFPNRASAAQPPPVDCAAVSFRTTSTEHGAWLTTDCATLPSSKRLRPV